MFDLERYPTDDAFERPVSMTSASARMMHELERYPTDDAFERYTTYDAFEQPQPLVGTFPIAPIEPQPGWFAGPLQVLCTPPPVGAGMPADEDHQGQGRRRRR